MHAERVIRLPAGSPMVLRLPIVEQTLVDDPAVLEYLRLEPGFVHGRVGPPYHGVVSLRLRQWVLFGVRVPGGAGLERDPFTGARLVVATEDFPEWAAQALFTEWDALVLALGDA